MDKLNALRALFLQNKHIRKFPENLSIFAGDGSTEGEQASNFALNYDAIIIVTEFPKNALGIIYPLRQWYLANQPSLPIKGIKWSVELLDNEGVDIEIIVPITEHIIATKQVGGTDLQSCDDIIPVEPEILQVYDQSDQLLEEKPDV